jgi:ABC-type cobalamin/Fe3+-siderophores transport system ATPase subunit
VAVSARVSGFAFSYGAFSLEVDELVFPGAKVTAVVGPNGAGKSTLLKGLAGLLAPARGGTYVDGRDVMAMRGRERARLVGYVPQEPAYMFNYEVLDFVLMGRSALIPLFSSPSALDVEAAREALRFVGLETLEARSCFELSSGERRLVLIARTLAQRPSVLLLDEPTTFLDPRHESEIMALVRRLAAEKDATVVVTLHALDMAVKYADAMVFLKGGRIVAAGPPDDILSEALLRSVYDVGIEIVDIGGRRVLVR